MSDLDPRYISYAMVVLVLAGGTWGVRKLMTSFAQRSAREKTGPLDDALREGNFHKAGRLALEQGDWEQAARHFLRAAKPLDAARALRKGEAWDRAADLFEQGRDYASAAFCYDRLGNQHARLRMLEAAGDVPAAAELADRLGDPRRAAELWLKAGRQTEAMAALQRAGDTKGAATLQAEQLERDGDWAGAAALWQAAQDPARALQCFDKAGDHRAAAQVLQRLGRGEQAADRLASAEAFADAAALYEALGLFRKAALNHQRAGDTERAIQCLTLEGDKIAVLKLRVALGQVDDALRVALAVSPTEAAYIEAAQIAATLQIQRGETGAAARTLLGLLDAPLQPAVKVATGRRAAELFVELQDGVRGRQALDKLNGLLAPGSEDETACRDLLQRMASLPAFEPVQVGHAAPVKSSTPTIAMAMAAAEHTETFEEGFEAAIEEDTAAYLGAQVDRRKPQGTPVGLGGPEGWPSGVPVALASRYGDLERLGQGGNGVVFRATDILLGRQVVLKFMIQGTMPSEIARKYFLREVKLSASLNHPNIVHIYDMGNVEDVLWYAMEYVEGMPLTAHLQGNHPVRDIVFLISVVEQLCAALDHAHGQGLVHRDIKPDNVLIASDGTVKLLDFGLARVLDDGFGEQSVLAGTPYYMAPEQLDGSAVDHRADIYALGVVLFRMFTGHLPFTEGNVFVAHAVEAVPDLRRFNRDLPDGAARVVVRCMAKKPADRYTNCRQIALDVHQALFGHVRG